MRFAIGIIAMRLSMLSLSILIALPASTNWVGVNASEHESRSLIPSPDGSQGTYASRITDANTLSTTVSNFGALGNNFISRAPSLEYPLGSGYEHMDSGGLWVGAGATDASGVFVGVTSATLDISQGSPLVATSEYTPGDGFTVRSTINSSRFYDPAAVSEQDLICLFDDLTPKSTSGNPEPHRPLQIQVRQTTHSWSDPELQDVVFQRYTITNVGENPLVSVWVGLCTQLASGNKNAYASWPPSSSSGPGSWYWKAWLQWDASLNMIREHYCSGTPPDGCNLDAVPYWMGVKLLTPPATGQAVTLAAWDWSPGNTARDQDNERWVLMSTGTIQDLSASWLQPVTGDPVELLALGPFATLAPGDSLNVDFALVGGADVADIQTHAQAAQTMHDMGYAFTVSVEPEPQSAHLALHEVFPNPSPAGELTIRFSLDNVGAARLDLYDVTGRRVATRDLRGYGPGNHAARWSNLTHLAPGLYLVHLVQGPRTITKRVIVVR